MARNRNVDDIEKNLKNKLNQLRRQISILAEKPAYTTLMTDAVIINIRKFLDRPFSVKTAIVNQELFLNVRDLLLNTAKSLQNSIEETEDRELADTITQLTEIKTLQDEFISPLIQDLKNIEKQQIFTQAELDQELIDQENQLQQERENEDKITEACNNTVFSNEDKEQAIREQFSESENLFEKLSVEEEIVTQYRSFLTTPIGQYIRPQESKTGAIGAIAVAKDAKHERRIASDFSIEEQGKLRAYEALGGKKLTPIEILLIFANDKEYKKLDESLKAIHKRFSQTDASKSPLSSLSGPKKKS